jgi:uncharacterized membrane protein
MLVITIALGVLTFVLLVAVRPRTRRTLDVLWRDFVINSPDRPAAQLRTVSTHAQRSSTYDFLVGVAQIAALAASLIVPALQPIALVLCLGLTVRTVCSTTWLHLRVHNLVTRSEDAAAGLKQRSDAQPHGV